MTWGGRMCPCGGTLRKYPVDDLQFDLECRACRRYEVVQPPQGRQVSRAARGDTKAPERRPA